MESGGKMVACYLPVAMKEEGKMDSRLKMSGRTEGTKMEGR